MRHEALWALAHWDRQFPVAGDGGQGELGFWCVEVTGPGGCLASGAGVKGARGVLGFCCRGDRG